MIVAGAQIGGVLESRDAFVTATGMFGELGFTDMAVFWPRPEFRSRARVGSGRDRSAAARKPRDIRAGAMKGAGPEVYVAAS
jgi:hypothetical protein